MTNTTSENIEQAAINGGMVTMQMDGLVKALRGQTTLEEVLRVTSKE
jgi:type II secretory ATPase GspE/PulE/Tfp pilus assembly ATPase PilB-like protein